MHSNIIKCLFNVRQPLNCHLGSERNSALLHLRGVWFVSLHQLGSVLECFITHISLWQIALE